MERDPGRDLVLLLEACSARLADEVLAAVRADVGDDVRFRDGFVIQHLVQGPVSISGLADLLGVSQQAASKQVVDLERRGIVVRHRDPDDGRSWLVSLGERGDRVVWAGRDARAAIADRIRFELGPSFDPLVDRLGELSAATGAMEHLMGRAIKPYEAR